jgi:c-di-GMP-binding flagellar brake protein YcgR
MPSSRAKPATKQPAVKPFDRRRRRHPRYGADFRVTVSCLLGNDYQKLEGHCRDLSEAGIAILLATGLNVGDVAGLSFSIPGSELAWEVRAVVHYRRGYHYGFEFLSLTRDQQAALNGYFSGLEPID